MWICKKCAKEDCLTVSGTAKLKCSVLVEEVEKDGSYNVEEIKWNSENRASIADDIAHGLFGVVNGLENPVYSCRECCAEGKNIKEVAYWVEGREEK